MKPRILDLFCGAGGAAMGYAQAGFEVVGVDIEPQPHYPFEFHQADAMDVLSEIVRAGDTYFGRLHLDAIHASPPCQAYSVMRSLHNAKEHPDLVDGVRERLLSIGLPYVIENVPGSPVRATLVLCGSMFGLESSEERYLRRHRLFEVGNAPLILSPPCSHRGRLAVGVYGHGSAGRLGQRMRTANRDEARVLMGTPDMTRDGMSQAIPPAYTEFIGKELLAALAERPALVGARAGGSDGALLHPAAPVSEGTTTVEPATDNIRRESGRCSSEGITNPGSRQASCDRCGKPAVMWSGAFGDPWLGWCSKKCQSAWLRGDKTSDDKTAGLVDRRTYQAQTREER